MIVVTGTNRSGTSMWMQILKAAGLPIIGEEYPRKWDTLREVNERGFWESNLRDGIYYRTNPNPQTRAYLSPEKTKRHAVKMFVPGLVRTDLAFMDHVIATMRPWREYVRSMNRLYTVQRNVVQPDKEPVFMPPVIEWWAENFSLLRDIVTRRYSCSLVAYDSVLGDTEETLRAVFRWLDGGDVDAAINAVDPILRVQSAIENDGSYGVDSETAGLFDEMYDIVLHGRPILGSFVNHLETANVRLSEQFCDAITHVKEARQAS